MLSVGAVGRRLMIPVLVQHRWYGQILRLPELHGLYGNHGSI